MNFLEILSASTLLLALLNPFLVIVYLIDVLQKVEAKKFRSILLNAGIIATVVFWCFAVLGDAIFSSVIKAELASFQIFGGIIFLLIGIQFVFKGPTAVEMLRGESQNLAGAIAMPILIGPGTISASILIGERLEPFSACVAVLLALVISILIMFALKATHDYVRPRNEPLINRYIEITGRITALYVGTISIEMIMRGLLVWIDKI